MTDLERAIEATLADFGVYTDAWVMTYEEVTKNGSVQLGHICTDTSSWLLVGMLYATIDVVPHLLSEDES